MASRGRWPQNNPPTDSLFFSGKGGPLPGFISKREISEFFSDFKSDIKRIVIFRDQGNNSKGKGFVTFSSVQVAKKALAALRGHPISSQSIPIHLNYFRKKAKSGQKPAVVEEKPPKSLPYRRSDTVKQQPELLGIVYQPEVVASEEMKWYWEEHGIYDEYDADTNNELASAWKCDNQGQCHVIIKGKFYIIDFKKMTQRNVSTGFVRNIKNITTSREKTLRGQEHTKASVAPKPRTLKVLDTSDTISSSSIRHHRDSILSSKDQFSPGSSLHMKTATVHVPSQLSVDAAFFKHVKGVLKPFKHNNHTVINKDRSATSQKLIQITGEKKIVDKAHSKLSSDILEYISIKGDIGAVQYPTEWEPQEKSCEMFTLKRSSDEWRDISLCFTETIKRVKVTEICRVQNRLLWEKYEQCRKRIRTKNGGNDNEKRLFHGSRSAPAEDIIQCEEGFDMRWSAEGLWGRANYFAEKASYSDSYAHKKPNQTKEILVARVLVGDSYHSPIDRTLRMPPQKASSTDGLRIRYDTVNGVTGGTRVYMTYDNEKAYPAYIIKYKHEPSPSNSLGYPYYSVPPQQPSWPPRQPQYLTPPSKPSLGSTSSHQTSGDRALNSNQPKSKDKCAVM